MAMMTDIENLIELICDYVEHMPHEEGQTWEEAFACHLIANGVTFAANTETRVFDKEETYRNCTVQILTNTVTGEVSVGWWRNDKPPLGGVTGGQT